MNADVRLPAAAAAAGGIGSRRGPQGSGSRGDEMDSGCTLRYKVTGGMPLAGQLPPLMDVLNA